MENATSFSSAETPVTVSGHLLNSGGVLLDISDQGVGMGAEEMAHANWRLDNPPVVDVAVSRRMGLFVVARLAARHGIRVRLRPATTGGLTALVWLPDETVTHEGNGSPTGIRRFERNGSGGTPDSLEALAGNGTGGEWGPRRGRSAAEEAVNAARAPRFTPLQADNGDSAATAGFPALTPSWDDPAPAPASSGPAWDDAPSVPDTPAWENPPAKPSGPSWDDPTPAASAPPPAASTGPMPAVPSNGTPPVFGTSLSGDGASQPPRLPTRPVRNLGSSDAGPARREVVVPPAGPGGEGNRLPIFESVESDWFRRGRHSADRPNSGAAAPEPSTSNTGGWAASAADEGWRAAEASSKPASGGVTLSGLPKRVPKANLVPGTVGANAEPASPPPVRSASVTRQRFASFQRGVREARAAVNTEDDADGEGDDVT